MSEKIVHIVVTGRVQGVGFRFFVEREALKIGVHGWARNRRDGTDEAVFAGTPEQIESILAACKKGPSASRVDRLDVAEASVTELKMMLAGERFSTLPTL